MRHELRPEDIEVFSEAITHFFNTCTGETANVRSAYLIEHGPAVLWNDFNGLIEISGAYTGSVCFSAPRALLSHVLLKMGESVFTDDRHADIVGEIANTLSGRARRHFGEGLSIAPGQLSFELVESIFLDESDDIVTANMEGINRLGSDIGIGDFGTGHTSIVSLLKIKPKRLKIDRQLVIPVLSARTEQALIRSIIDIARSLGIETVAEGVETMAHAE
eukprot:gene10836-13756_t